MFWRGIAILVTLLWLVMTGLLVRNTYFPSRSGMTDLPPSLVFDSFLKQAAESPPTLYLYHESEPRKRLGDVSFYVFDERGKDEPYQTGDPFQLKVAGNVFHAALAQLAPKGMRWLLTSDWHGDKKPRRTELELTSGSRQDGQMVTVKWEEGDSLPELEVKRGGKVVMDTRSAVAMANLGQQMGLLEGFLGRSRDGKTQMFSVEARGGMLNLAGSRRRGFALTFKVLERYEVQALFTEAGEIARIDLPDGYRLLETLSHGLEPDFEES